MADARTSGVYPLDELDDFKVADEDIDPRGWSVYSQDGQKLGEVKDLLVDMGAMKVRYLDVELDRDVAGASRDNRHVLFPVGTARLDDADDRVFVNAAASSVAGLPAYTRGGPVSREYENSVRSGFVTAAGTTAGTAAAAGEVTAAELDYYNHDHYDTDRFYGNRQRGAAAAGTSGMSGASSTAGEARMVLSEEELRVGKQQRQAGEVDVRKRVETEHVQETVPVMREEVSIDRRPLAADANVEIGAQEIRVPVSAEEVTVDKRAVVKEEIVIKKHAVVENQNVEADLRKERVDIDRNVAGTSGTANLAGSTGTAGSDVGNAARNVANKAIDAVDNVKDRVDGNPASKPGRDATDSRL